MKTGELLDSLISISGISKTDYAISVYTTPSGLSFILSGKRLPRPTEKRLFANNQPPFWQPKSLNHNAIEN